jgi:peroxiredoxin
MAPAQFRQNCSDQGEQPVLSAENRMDATNQTPAQTRPARTWVSLGLLVAVILVYLLLVTNRARQPLGTDGPAIGKQLRHLELAGLTGDAESVSLESLRGKVVLVNYWGTWCPPCVRELPEIEAIGRRFAKREDFRLLAVSCGQGGDEAVETLRSETEQFLAARQSSLATYVDPGADSRRAMHVLLNVPIAYPTTLLLDREGTIRGLWQGYVPRAADEMEAEIEKLLVE